jgi:hypothetical protein
VREILSLKELSKTHFNMKIKAIRKIDQKE